MKCLVTKMNTDYINHLVNHNNANAKMGAMLITTSTYLKQWCHLDLAETGWITGLFEP